MKLRNGSIYQITNSKDTIQRLLRAGWQEVEEEKTEPKCDPVPAEKPIAAPTLVIKKEKPLIYKGRYLSQWLQVGKVDELRAVLTHLGVPFERTTPKKELQRLLRDQIREIKERKDGNEDDG